MSSMTVALPSASPEFALLLACARNEDSVAAVARLHAVLDAAPDWPRVLGLAERHGLVALVRKGLIASQDARVPAATHAALKQESLRIGHRSLALTAELGRLAALLRARDIPVLAYKGPALAVMAYGSVALRPFVDLDIIVPRSRVRAARELLTTEGYRPEVALPARQEAAHLRTGYDLAFHRARDRATVEVHWAVAPRYFGVPIDFAALYERAASVALPGGDIVALSASDLLPLLCVHGARHLWARLESVAAIAGLVRRHGDIDWTGVLAQATRDGVERILLLGLALAQDLLDLPLPSLVAARCRRHPSLDTLVATFRARLERGEQALPGVWHAARLQLALRERLRDRVRYGVGGAFDPSERDRAEWRPAGFGPLRALARPLRLLRDHGWRRPGA